VLYSWQKGEADIVCADGSSMVLQDVLYVPNLGISLLSAQKLCNLGMEGGFNHTQMYFYNKEDPHMRKLITATHQKGLYVVSHVSKKFASFQQATPGNGTPLREVQDASKRFLQLDQTQAFPTQVITSDDHATEPESPLTEGWETVKRKSRYTRTLPSNSKIPLSNRYSALDSVVPEIDTSPIEYTPAPQRDDLEISMSKRTRYNLVHRRVGHLGPKIIGKLHKITTLKSPVRIPSKRLRDICDVCALTKMTNRIPKELSPHKLSKLDLVQLDIAGPFPKSLRGNRYFCLIIDSATRMEWILCLKAKSDAGPAVTGCALLLGFA